MGAADLLSGWTIDHIFLNHWPISPNLGNLKELVEEVLEAFSKKTAYARHQLFPILKTSLQDSDSCIYRLGCWRLFIADNAKHIGEFRTMNNGHDWLSFEEVAGILSDELGESIAFDGSYEGFMEFWGPRMGKKADRLWNFFKVEEANEEQWALNNFVERILGRKPTTVRGWIVEHKDGLLNAEH
ncbi:hypothetical protein FMUND_7087 [Fusarium mundagurra]|uniref:Uncharacterized protein n=1 Tax=Fusarium mundagurra TaxID=1567541 RepID=A0A8H5YLV2_9HYPO|nr:hypothetical protein FMUND_7087 [Fusarium mundagurra]